MTGLCGKCLHSRESHHAVNGHLMYCVACQKHCDLEDYNVDYKPTNKEDVFRISALKQ